MQRINQLGLKEAEKLKAKFFSGDYDALHAGWEKIRSSRAYSFKTFDEWKDMVHNLIDGVIDLYKTHKNPHRFYSNETGNMQVNVFVMGGFNNEPFETSSSISITLHH